jgi:GlpG protein
MRQIGTIPNESQARVLVDYLLTRTIDTQLIPDGTGWEIWVRDEDRVPQAREELAAFLANPADPRFAKASDAAVSIRRAEKHAEEAYRKRQIALGQKMRGPISGGQPLTISVIVLCVIVAWLTRLGAPETWLSHQMMMIPYQLSGDYYVFERLSAMSPFRTGQPWRLLTPALLHFSLMHLGFNMLGLYYLGTQIEARRGWVRLLLMMLVIGVLSNLAEYEFGDPSWRDGQISLHFHWTFGGMSGVIFGLFGYIWMKMRFEPDLGMGFSQQTFVMSMIWLVLCVIGAVGSIANGAHISGLLLGMIIGAAPPLWKRLWR